MMGLWMWVGEKTWGGLAFEVATAWLEWPALAGSAGCAGKTLLWAKATHAQVVEARVQSAHNVELSVTKGRA